MYFLGIDVNTYRVEAVVLDSKNGKAQSVSEAFTPLSSIVRPKPIQPRHAWEKVKEVTGKLLREYRLRGDDIVGIAVTSTQDAWVPVGDNWDPLYPLINIQLNPFDKHGTTEFFEVNGRGDRILSGAQNLEWFRRTEPDLYSRMYKWLNLAEYIGVRLAGEVAVDAAAASRYGVLDIKRREWSESLMSRFGIRSQFLPEIVPPGTAMGKLTRRSAAEMGLKAETPVLVASSGPSCAALACCLDQCNCLNIIAENELLLTRLSPEKAFEINPADGYCLEPHVNGTDYLCIGMLPFSIPAVLWVVENFFPHLAERPIEEILSSLQAKLELVPAGSDGLLFLPHLIGSGTPKADPASRGVIVGLKPDHSKWHVYRAVLEGIAYELRANLQTITKATGRETVGIAAQGWGAENRVALQIKSDVTGVPFTAGSSASGPACGAAHLAASGLGYIEVKDLFRSAYSRVRATYSPDSERKSRYNLQYTRVYTDLYRSLESTFSKLS